MAYQVFVSHTKEDIELCDMFDRACARVGLKAFRSEFETIEIPQWKTIKEAMDKSIAMFLLVGTQLVAHQMHPTPDWKYTQNWIAFETGLACQKGIDVWVYCDNVDINFPVPYFNNYAIYGMRTKENFDWLRGVLDLYNRGTTFREPIETKYTSCPYKGCGIDFNLHSVLPPGQTIKCPQCLKDIVYPKGFLTS